jgi:hypothetical protein
MQFANGGMPSNADWDGLAPMLIFSGTNDLFHADIIALANKAAQAGVPARYTCERGFNTTIRCCRLQKGGRHATSLHAQLVALPFELTSKLPVRVPNFDIHRLSLVAIGTAIAGRPPHRAVPAPLCIRLPPWMTGGEAFHRVRVKDAGNWNPSGKDQF